jgi:hypothetical protein
MASDRLRRRGVIERWRSEGDTRTVRGPGALPGPPAVGVVEGKRVCLGLYWPALFDLWDLPETEEPGSR